MGIAPPDISRQNDIFGAKGVGEPSLTPVAPAIANAVANAIGTRVFDLPITPEKVVNALGKGR